MCESLLVNVSVILLLVCRCIFFFKDTATTEIYTELTHSFPTRRSSDLGFAPHDAAFAPRQGTAAQIGEPGAAVRQFHQIAMAGAGDGHVPAARAGQHRSEEHTSELQSLMRSSYAVFCLKKKITYLYTTINNHPLRTVHVIQTNYP